MWTGSRAGVRVIRAKETTRTRPPKLLDRSEPLSRLPGEGFAAPARCRAPSPSRTSTCRCPATATPQPRAATPPLIWCELEAVRASPEDGRGGGAVQRRGQPSAEPRLPGVVGRFREAPRASPPKEGPGKQRVGCPTGRLPRLVGFRPAFRQALQEESPAGYRRIRCKYTGTKNDIPVIWLSSPVFDSVSGERGGVGLLGRCKYTGAKHNIPVTIGSVHKSLILFQESEDEDCA